MRRFTRTIIGLLLLLPLNATSLGLGEIELRSALNQPLDAEIGLTSLGQTPVDEIRVGLASSEAFTRAGLPRPLFLSDLRFEVTEGSEGPVVRVTSSDPVVEPFLDFLVEVNWPSGRLLREYTVLVDPPLFLDEAPAPIAPPAAVAEAPAAGNSTQTTSIVEAPAPRRAAGRESGARLGAAGAWEYGPVERDATLWSIAEEMRALDDSWSIEQIMMALLRDNPDAFYNGNINELKAGYVLRIEDPATVGMMSRAEAIAEARRQAEQWMDTRSAVAGRAESRPQGGESAPAPAGAVAAAPADPGPRLRLSAPEGPDAERMAAGAAETGEEGATVARLREELAAALEVSESARQENADLRQRLTGLEEQIASMQRLISLQEDTLAALQLGAGAATGSEPAPQTAPQMTEEDAAAGQPADDQARQAAPAAPPVGQVDDSPVAMPLDQVFAMLEDPLMLGFAGLVVLALAVLGWLVARRRRLARESLEQFTAMPDVATGAAAAAPAVAAGGPGQSADGAVAAGSDPVSDEEDEFEAAVGGAAKVADTAPAMQAEEDEIDILAEADVYLAYRRFDKAEDILRAAIQEDPQRHDLMLKLLEVLAAGGNVEGFTRQAEAGRAGLEAAGTWQKVVAMGRRIAPEEPLFTVGAADGAPAAETAGAPTAQAADAPTDLSDMLSADDFDLGDLGGELQDVDPSLSREEAGGEDFATGTGFDASFAIDDELAETNLAADADAPEGGAEFHPEIDEQVLAALEADGQDSGSGAVPDSLDEGLRTADVLHLDRGAARSGVAEQGGSADDISGGDATLADEGSDREREDPHEIDWLSAVGDDLAAFEGDDVVFEGDGDEDFSGLISGTDEIGTKLDLAKAYIDMGDQDSARSILNEVTEEGSEDQQREASELMRQIG